MLLLMFGFFCASYMRSNIGMTMTCIINSTAVAIETTKSHEALLSTNVSHLEIPEQCQHEGIEEENGVVVNDYGVRKFIIIIFYVNSSYQHFSC